MKNRASLLIAAATILIASQSWGIVTYDDGGSHDITSDINDDVWVDYGAPGMETEVNLLAGGETHEFRGYNDSRLNISGGSTADYDLSLYDDSRAMISDGSVGLSLELRDSSQVIRSGGTVENGYTWAANTSALVIQGDSFRIDGTPVDYGVYTASDYSSGNLTGILANGDMLDEDFHIYDDASMELIPEPGSALLSLFGLGFLFLLKSIRKAKETFGRIL